MCLMFKNLLASFALEYTGCIKDEFDLYTA